VTGWCPVAKNGAAYRPERVRDIPPGEPWVPHSAALLASDAMRSLSRLAFLMLMRLEVEHCAHAGKENGYLVVTYNQFVDFGILRRLVRPTIAELQSVGLLVVEHKGRYGPGRNKTDANQYRLTYLKSKFVPVAGVPYYLEPTNEWRHYIKPPKSKPAARKSCFSVPMGELLRFQPGNRK
jgi:hypothetical protein